MKSGKLNWDDLHRIISENRTIQRSEVRVRGGIGEDCSVVNFGDYDCVLSTDPITGASEGIGSLAVHINCNDVASCGVAPLGILITILAPEGTELEEINKLMQEVNAETAKLNVEILGGHTEITSAVNKMVVSCTVIGRAKAGKAVATAGAHIGDFIIVTKDLGLEGTSIVLNDYYNEVSSFLTEEEISQGKAFSKELSVVREGVIAGSMTVHSMHDITEGGVLGALWEVASAADKGFMVFDESMPVRAVTSKLCSHYGIDVLRFISSGSMLICTSQGEELVKELNSQGIKATIIGRITKEKGIIIKDGVEIIVPPPERDELFVLQEIIRSQKGELE